VIGIPKEDFITMLDKYLPDWQLHKKELDDFIALPFVEQTS